MTRRSLLLALLVPLLPAPRVLYRAVVTKEQARCVFTGINASYECDRTVVFNWKKDNGLEYVSRYVIPRRGGKS